MGEQTLDVYRDWLGIKDTNRPLNYYQLLRLKMFEDDVAKIRKHYRKLNAHVRKFATGQYWEESQKLLNELARAMLCLTDQKRKAEYDASLGRKESGPTGRRTLEQILVSQGAVTSEGLQKARNYSMVVGVDVRDALWQQKLVPQEVVMQAYAEAEGLPYIDLKEIEPDENLLDRVPAVIARQHSCVPVMIDEDALILASPNPLAPEVEEELRLRLGIQVRVAICSPAAVNELVNKYYPKEKAQAELASGKGTAAPAAAAQPSATTSSPRKSRQRTSASAKQERLKLTLAAGMLSFGAVSVFRSLYQNAGFTGAVGVGLLVGAGVAAATWFVLGLRK